MSTAADCTNWQMRCNCDRCQRDRRSLLALQASDSIGWADQVVFQTRLYQEEIRELREALTGVSKRRAA